MTVAKRIEPQKRSEGHLNLTEAIPPLVLGAILIGFAMTGILVLYSISWVSVVDEPYVQIVGARFPVQTDEIRSVNASKVIAAMKSRGYAAMTVNDPTRVYGNKTVDGDSRLTMEITTTLDWRWFVATKHLSSHAFRHSDAAALDREKSSLLPEALSVGTDVAGFSLDEKMAEWWIGY